MGNYWIKDENAFISLGFKRQQYQAFVDDVVVRNSFEVTTVSITWRSR